jgi:hypothetical protein
MTLCNIVICVKVIFPESWADGFVLCPWAFHAGAELVDVALCVMGIADAAKAEQPIHRIIRMGKR